MLRRSFLRNLLMGGTAFSSGWPLFLNPSKKSTGIINPEYDIIIVGGTPAGIMAGISAARLGKKALILERTRHIGGLPANGLGATDISTRGATGGLFLEFIQRINNYYVKTYGAGSQQVLDCSGGYHFEPSVAEMTFKQMVESEKNLTILTEYQFDPLTEHVQLNNETIQSIQVLNRNSNEYESFSGSAFIDATYEGDLIAAAGVPYEIGREGFDEYEEPYSGRVYKYWNGPKAEGSTQLGDNSIQAFNYRLCLTDDPSIRVDFRKPENYNREEYLSLIEDVKTGRHTGHDIVKLTEEQIKENKERINNGEPPEVPGMPNGIWRLTNMVKLPNNKTDANNQHLAFISTDLPEENWPWPSSSWHWRDKFAKRLKDYTLGLFWFAQHDPELPEWFKKETRKWGLASTEYTDNDNFPRQVYVREGRRMKGKYFFKAHDALPDIDGGRPPLHKSSITASHYAVDSHAVRKREPGRVHLDGFLNYRTKPYTVPYGVIVPEKVSNLLAPVPVSGTHLGFSTLRMEPCWMALGQAAGTAAVISINSLKTIQDIPLDTLQKSLIDQGAVLIYFEDMNAEDPDFKIMQQLGIQGVVRSWKINPDIMVDETTARLWAQRAGLQNAPVFKPGETSNRDYLKSLYEELYN